MDHIIRDAVEKHHPAYNDKAWEKMEKKLDKHLPQKEDRRRYLFFLLLFLLLGGGTFLGITYLNKDKNPTDKEIAENKKTEQLQPGNKKEQQLNIQPVTKTTAPEDNTTGNLQDKTTAPVKENDKNNPAANAETAAGNTATVPGNNAADRTKTKPVKETSGIRPGITSNTMTKTKNLPTGSPVRDAVITGRNKRSGLVKKGESIIRISASNPGNEMAKNENQETKVKVRVQRKENDKVNIAVTAAAPENDESKNGTAIVPELKDSKDIAGEQKKDSVKTGEEKKKKEVAVAENKTSSSTEKKKPKKNITGNFGITVSAGPDLSFIKLNKFGKVTLTYGAGLSYTFKKRVAIRAGFYASKKIYTATPDQYFIPPTSYYPGLYEVGADCKVYEIPVSLSYHFWQRKNHNWFGNAGLSSFLMKNEKYDYQYKTAYGPYTYKTEIRDQNKHYFAVLTLSAGYQYRFNKWLSLQAEPFVKLPLAGVGQGKVKLKSSGLLFTITVNPFTKRK